MLPGRLTGLDIQRGQERRTKIAGGAIDKIADANGVEEHIAHAIGEPQLLGHRRAAFLFELNCATPRFVRGRHEEHVIRSPDWRAAVQVVTGVVRMRPQNLAIGRIEPHDAATREKDDLIAAAEIDHDRRCIRGEKVTALPHHAAITLPERHHRLSWPAHRTDNRVAIGNQTAAESDFDDGPNQKRRRVEILLQIVLPENLAADFVERDHQLVGADGKESVADNQRCRMRARAKTEVLDRRRIRVFPEGRAGLGIHRDDEFLGLPRTTGASLAGARPIHRVDPPFIDQNRRVAGPERAAPQCLGAALGPLVGEATRLDDEIAVRASPLAPAR